MKIGRFIPLIVPTAVLILFEILFFFPRSLYAVLFICVLLLSLSVREVLKKSNKNERWINLVILPISLVFSALLLSVMLPIKIFEGQMIVQFLFIFSSIMLYYYYRLIYDYLINTSRYNNNSLSYFSSYANFIIIYLVASSAFGLQSFLSIPIWLTILLILIFTAITTYEVMWSNMISGPLSYFYISIVCLIIFELAWAVSFLTLSYYILGLLIAIAYYVIVGLVKFQLLKILNKNIIKTYLTLGLVSLLVVLMTARWI